ncbi:MAG: putative nucleolar protein [Benjaminiella poitrasii]|nr:MAG: putative nucleolar protein [Benjaminiella poitrasii]
MSSLLPISTKVDNQLDNLFKHSAGKSEIAVKPILTEQLIAKAAKKTKNQEKKDGQKAYLGFKKAKELMAQKRKAEEEEENETTKKAKKTLSPEEIAEKELKTVFVGNLTIECIEKEGYKQLKARFADCGKIESIRFRSIAFAQPMNRKAAFLSRKLHPDREALNAYIVFKTKEAANEACKLNGTVFMDKHLRVDGAANSKQHDRKRSVFLGALPFDVEDEELWEFFKDCGDIESVRVIRDPKMNIGKGFGYVQFVDRDSVEAALALTDKKFRKKTKIRIQRCKIPVSEGGVRETKKNANKKTKGGKPFNKSGKSGRALPNAKRFEGTRAVKDSGKKFKIVKTSKKKIAKKGSKK